MVHEYLDLIKSLDKVNYLFLIISLEDLLLILIYHFHFQSISNNNNNLLYTLYLSNVIPLVFLNSTPIK